MDFNFNFISAVLLFCVVGLLLLVVHMWHELRDLNEAYDAVCDAISCRPDDWHDFRRVPETSIVERELQPRTIA